MEGEAHGKKHVFKESQLLHQADIVLLFAHSQHGPQM